LQDRRFLAGRGSWSPWVLYVAIKIGAHQTRIWQATNRDTADERRD